MFRSKNAGAVPLPHARRRQRAYAIGIGAGLAPILIACLLLWPDGSPEPPAPPKKAACGTKITVMSSTEKAVLLKALAEEFVQTPAGCYQVEITATGSGAALTALAGGLQAGTGSAADLPEVWSPASSVWYRLLERRTDKSGKALFDEVLAPITQTPLVIALPKPIAEELTKTGPLTWDRILGLANDPAAWKELSKDQWGPFTLGKTNPNFSTAGLTSLLTEYAALSTANPGAVSEPDTRDSILQEKLKTLELATIHYGKTTLDYLCKLAAADKDSAVNALRYVSAVPVEEKSVYDYNSGNRDWCEHKLEPKVPLVPVALADGTIMSDSPFAVLARATPDQVALAHQFHAWLGEQDQQKTFTEAGFRHLDGTLDEAVAKELGVTKTPLTKFTQLPDGPVIDAVLDSWENIRKPARVLLVVDTSLSMKYSMIDNVPAETGEESRLDRAKDALTSSLADFSRRDEVGLWTFSGDSSSSDKPYREVVAPGLIDTKREELASGINRMRPSGATALYVTIAAAHDWLEKSTTGSYIKAVIVLTDGADSYKGGAYKQSQLTQAISASGAARDPVRVFPIAYGVDAKGEMLEQLGTIASVSGGGSYPAVDRSTIREVLLEVISNF
ncbi:substrate-binding domain-containing protein [Micromonospora arida]|uniref:vWA domain-containing protein n=1 Tax=Micromonospora arida TaxID=2203715 RepID=UPI0033CD9C6B